MKTLAEVKLNLQKNSKFYFVVVASVVCTLLIFTTTVSLTHATGVRQQQMKIHEIESLSEERNELDQVYLQNQKQIETLQQTNAEIKRQQNDLANSAKQKRIEFVHDYGCEVMT
jgi:FtsZ-binding cell division protein ZapB